MNCSTPNCENTGTVGRGITLRLVGRVPGTTINRYDALCNDCLRVMSTEKRYKQAKGG